MGGGDVLPMWHPVWALKTLVIRKCERFGELRRKEPCGKCDKGIVCVWGGKGRMVMTVPPEDWGKGGWRFFLK